MELLLYAVPIALALGAMAIGIIRVSSRTWLPLAIGFGTLAGSAFGCYAISMGKSGHYLAGLIGALFAMLLGLCAGAIGTGVILRWLYQQFQRGVAKQMVTIYSPPSRPWDIAIYVLLSLAGLILSAIE
ncbi:hypothetical protein JJJ17_04880 [Paracoccus caeni]|uniref:Uncharacterized protein n=1 Tax=Paracoccus caeni TaxID=657651 RepID=A0A934SAK9_9RHOB|nr:hypothetical protein [Paracoccus caeni]MBK4215256.1 hypothetical protein [Paracoccus caeni]